MTSMDEQPEPPVGNQSSADDSRPSPAAQASRSGARFWLRIALPLMVLIVVVVATVYVVAGGQLAPKLPRPAFRPRLGQPPAPGPGATPASHSPSATRKASGHAGGVQASGIPAGGLTGSAALTKLGSTALPLPKKLQAAVAAWDAGHGGRALAVLSSQFGIVLQAAGVKQYVPMKIACVRLAAASAASAACLADSGCRHAAALREGARRLRARARRTARPRYPCGPPETRLPRPACERRCSTGHCRWSPPASHRSPPGRRRGSRPSSSTEQPMVPAVAWPSVSGGPGRIPSARPGDMPGRWPAALGKRYRCAPWQGMTTICASPTSSLTRQTTSPCAGSALSTCMWSRNLTSRRSPTRTWRPRNRCATC